MSGNMPNARSEIQSFYKGKSIFLTGATGFLGKAILEKLLRCCPDLGTVFVLLRPKNGIDPKLRVKSLFGSPIFELLKSQNEDALEKIYPISGDITKPDLGLSSEARQLLIDKVSVIIHSGACVKFNQEIKGAMEVNYNGTQKVLELAKETKGLEAFVHVSTAYSNCDREHISEKIYKVSTAPCSKEIENWDEAMAKKFTPILLGERPNTYTYTKALAEQLLQEQRGNVPVIIIRPSIIGPSWKEPAAGYIDTFGGYAVGIAAAGNGFLKYIMADGSCVSDTIPLDIVANLIITSATRCEGFQIYNCCSDPKNPITWENVVDYMQFGFEATPCNNIYRYPSLSNTKYSWVFILINFILTYIPIVIIDILVLSLGKKSKMTRTYKKVMSTLQIYSYFTTRQWSFEVGNMDKLRKSLSEMDRQMFYTNVGDVDWKLYMKNYVFGVKKWLLKEKMEPREIERAKRRMQRVYWIQKLVWGLIIIATIYWGF